MVDFVTQSKLENGVLRVEYSHIKANCLSIELVASLRSILAKYEGNSDVQVLYVKPQTEKVYSAGANLGDYRKFSETNAIADYLFQIGSLLVDILYFPCTTITKMQGKAVGGGVGLISAFDYVVGSSTSNIRLSELSLGIAPLVISPLLLLKLGLGKFSELSFSGTWKDSTWAYQNGLFSEVVSDGEIDKIIEERISHFTNSGVTSVKEMKSRTLPLKSDFLIKIKENSVLNAPHVFEAIKNKKI